MKEGISLVVCCYNDADLLEYFLESVLVQGKLDFPFELLVIDNASTDNTCTVFNQYKERFTKQSIQYYYFFETKRGLNHARNRGIQQSQYSYIGFTDADAKLSPKYLNTLKNLIDQNHPVLLCGPYKPWYNTTIPKWYKDSYNEKNYGNVSKYLKEGETPCGVNMIFNKSILENFEGFGTEIVYKGNNDRGEETELFYRYEEKGYSDFIFYSPDLVVYHYTRQQTMLIKTWIKSSWGVGKNQAKYKKNPGIFKNIKDVCWILKELLKDVAKYTLKDTRSEHKYFQNFIVEDIAPRIFDLSLSIHFIINTFLKTRTHNIKSIL